MHEASKLCRDNSQVRSVYSFATSTMPGDNQGLMVYQCCQTSGGGCRGYCWTQQFVWESRWLPTSAQHDTEVLWLNISEMKDEGNWVSLQTIITVSRSPYKSEHMLTKNWTHGEDPWCSGVASKSFVSHARFQVEQQQRQSESGDASLEHRCQGTCIVRRSTYNHSICKQTVKFSLWADLK